MGETTGTLAIVLGGFASFSAIVIAVVKALWTANREDKKALLALQENSIKTSVELKASQEMLRTTIVQMFENGERMHEEAMKGFGRLEDQIGHIIKP